MNTEKSNNNETQSEKVKITTKSKILLPVIFVLTLTVALCGLLVKDFKDGLSNIVIWCYFGVVLLYVGVSILDAVMNKQDKKKCTFIIVFSILVVIADILFIIFIR